MKIGKTRNKSGILKVLLGLVAAGALLFASCQNIFDMAESKTQDADEGYGYVYVDMGDSLRTARPELSEFTKFEYIFKGYNLSLGTTDNEITFVHDTPATTPFRLPAGDYTLNVKAYTVLGGAPAAGTSLGSVGAGPLTVSATGKYSENNGVFTILGNGLPTNLKIVLTANHDEAAAGKLYIKITTGPLDSGAEIAVSTYKLVQYSGNGAPLASINLTSYFTGGGTPVVANADGSYTVTGGTGLTIDDVAADKSGLAWASGTYVLTARINTDKAKYGGFSEAIHVVDAMTTRFERDFTKAEYLSAITSADEARAILRDEIRDWITAVGADKNDKALTDKESVGKGITFEPAGDDGIPIINLYYVASRTTLTTSPAGNFPITLRGGWKTTLNSNGGTSGNNNWFVNNNIGPTTVTLKNDEVEANGNTILGTGKGEETLCKVILRPIAEYTVVWGKRTAPVDAKRKIIVTGPAGSDNIVLNSTDEEAGGIGLVGDTEITITESAIILWIGDQRVDASGPASGSGTYPFTAESKEYKIEAFRTVNEQAEVAFADLRANLMTEWVQEKAALTYSQSNKTEVAGLVIPTGVRGAPEFETTLDEHTGVNTLPAYYGGADTVTMYYVKSRHSKFAAGALPAGSTFDINVPIQGENGDDRWAYSDEWKMTNGSVVIDSTSGTLAADIAQANGGDTKTIYYTPYGGTPQPFKIVYKPVAEFYVNYVEEDPDDSTVYPAATSNVTIKGGDVTTALDFKLGTNVGKFGTQNATTGTQYKGRKFSVGTTVFTVTDVTIMGDFTTEVSNGSPLTSTNFDYFLYTGTPGPWTQAQQTASPLANNNNIAGQVSSAAPDITVSAINSREYHIVVYRTLQKQLTDAQNKIKGLPSNDAINWGAKTTPGTVVIHPDGLKAPTGTSVTDLLTSSIIYAGVEPTITIREVLDPTDGSTLEDWSDIWDFTGTPDTVVASGIKTLKLKFTPKGAPLAIDALASAAANSGVYFIKLIPAVLYRVNYKDFPITKNPASGPSRVEGTITVKGAGLDDGVTLVTTPREYLGSSGTTVGANTYPAYEFYGAGADLTAQAMTTTPAGKINVIKNGANVSAHPTSTTPPANTLTITKPGLPTVAAQATPIDIDVYPSVEDQHNDFITEIKKVNQRSLIDWSKGGLTSATSVTEGFAAPGDLDDTTNFKVVATLNQSASTGLQIEEPTGYLSSNYMGGLGFTIDNAGTGTNFDAYGNKIVEIKFTSIGNKSATATDADKVYKFKLTAVAQYNVLIQNGPTGDKPGSYLVDLVIDTYQPGTNGAIATGVTKPDLNPIEFNQGTLKTTYYGGIGAFGSTTGASGVTPAANVIKSSKGNIIYISAGGGAYSMASGSSYSIASPTSQVYNIRVYPTVNDQVTQVRAKLAKLPTTTTSASGWFTNSPKLLGPWATLPAVGDWSEGPGGFKANGTNNFDVMYYGTTLPAMDVPVNTTTVKSGSIITPLGDNALAAAVTAAGYDYGLTAVSGGAADAFGVTTMELNYTPMGPAASGTYANPIYTIKLIPLVKYKVTYMNGANGTVSVTGPTGSIFAANPFKVNALNPPSSAPLYGYAGYNTTTPSLDTTVSISATDKAYTEVIVRKVGDTTTSKSIKPGDADGTGLAKITISPRSEEWEIIVMRENQ